MDQTHHSSSAQKLDPDRQPICSRLSGFYNLEVPERLRRLAEMMGLSQRDQWQLLQQGLTLQDADMLIENVVGLFAMPVGIATNFRINNRDYLVPMVVEETSVIAAASSAAKLVRDYGNLTAAASGQIMIGQIQIASLPDIDAAQSELLAAKPQLLDVANMQDPVLVKLGGGAIDLETRRVQTESGPMLVAHLLVDARDAMGANAVNTMAETLGPMLADITGGELICQIISNLADRRLVRARMEVAVEALAKAGYSGPDVASRLVKAFHWADADPYRAATHNKGAMNAIDAILLATGNDWRAVEAGAHAYAARSGRYRSITTYRIEDGRLIGEIELPMAVGLVGGVTRLHPVVKVLLKILQVHSASELAEVIAAAGLLQNFSAMRSLVTEGIQRGHMSLHARNLAVLAGARGDLIDRVAKQMIIEGQVRYHRAQEILAKLNGHGESGES